MPSPLLPIRERYLRLACMGFQIVLAAALLAVALYAQYRIPFHTVGKRKVILTRTVLAVVGVLLGIVAATLAPDRQTAMVAFLQSFGVVHVPAAFILFLKRARREGRS
ncbi:MAG: hypothetical protein KIS79_14495 [Burkholderiales bacterium]|nr:hypothetical protein [Burkholderiales bacterium]